MKIRALKAAFPYTVPILVAFLFIGISYGFLMVSEGFPAWYPVAMSVLIFAGSMQFVTVGLLLAAFNPLHAFLLTLMVNARHMFYGVSMLEKFRDCGLKKPYLIYGMCDESFSVNCAAAVPEGVDRGWFMFFVTLLNQIYWVGSSALGALMGKAISFDTTGIDFVMTALFVVLFVNQWQETKDHRPALVGLAGSLLCLCIFGADGFILPAMALIIIFFTVTMPRKDRGAEQ